MNVAKCKGCGKWRVFLKLQKGLCSACIDALWPDDANPLISKEEFLSFDTSKPLPPDPVVCRNTDYVPEGCVVASNGSFLPVEILPDVFAFDGICRIDNNFYEITGSGNIARALKDILAMNSFIEQANQKHWEVPKKSFNKERLNFRFSEAALSRDYCMLEFAPLTKNGKLSKYPIRLYINQKSSLAHYDITGSIFYMKDGGIEKAELTLHERVVYTLNIAVVDGTLTVKSIYRNEAGFKQKIYSCE